MASNRYLNGLLHYPNSGDLKAWESAPILIKLGRRGYHVYPIASYAEDEKPCILALVSDGGFFHLIHCSYLRLFPEENRFTSLEEVYSFITKKRRAGNLKNLKLMICLEELKNRLILDKAGLREG